MPGKSSRREAVRMMLAASLVPAIPEAGFAIAAAPRASGRDRAWQRIRERIENAIAKGGATGVAISVVAGGRIVWEEGFGFADRAAGLRVTPHTPFGMASITKPFTTTTIMTLVAGGRLALDSSANKLLGDSKLTGTAGDPDAVTVRMLGSHVSGLPGIYESYVDSESSLVPTPEQLLQAYGRMAYPPAQVYEYSNIGYAALHQVALRLTQTELGALMHTAVLSPLGLQDTFFASEKMRVAGAAVRYDSTGKPIPHSVTSTPASGELYASAHDLARFLLFNMGHRLQPGTQLLGAKYLAELHRPVFTGPSGIACTFGWFTGRTASGVPFFFKSGGDPGVANRMCFVPSRDLGCVVLTNQSIAQELAYGICDEVMRMELPDWTQPREYCGPQPTPLPSNNPFTGKWPGVLQNDGMKLPVSLQVNSPASATLRVGANAEQAINGIQAAGEALTGTCEGDIGSPDTLRSGARALHIQLVPDGERLTGRVTAVAGDPSVKNVALPYVLTLHKSRP